LFKFGFLPRFSLPLRLRRSKWHRVRLNFSSQFFVREPLAHDLAHGKIEPVRIV
jgi:hypothetical protein